MISPAEVAEFLQVGWGRQKVAELCCVSTCLFNSQSSPRLVHVLLSQVDHLQKQCHLFYQ